MRSFLLFVIFVVLVIGIRTRVADAISFLTRPWRQTGEGGRRRRAGMLAPHENNADDGGTTY